MQDIFLYVVLAAMLAMMFLNGRKRKKAAEELQNKVAPGAKVILMSGIVGTIVSAEEDRIVLKTGGSNIEVLRAAVRTVNNDAAEPAVDLAKTQAAPKAATKAQTAAKPAAKTVAKPAAKPIQATKSAKPAAKKN
jgi:preprotein translocase subunit YajC